MSTTQLQPTHHQHQHEHVHGPGCSHGHCETIRKEPKIGRNDKCPCNSGLKYKKCCGKG